MNVCFFNSNRAWGGGEKWHLDMASGLYAKGCHVVLIAGSKSELLGQAQKAKIPYNQIRVTNLSFLNIMKVLKLVWYFRKQQFETIIINLSADLKLAGISAKLAGVKNIIYRRGLAKPVRNTVFNRFLFQRIISRIIANSEETKRTLVQNNSKLFPVEKIITLYNGIDLKKLDNMPVINLFEKKENEVVIGNAGRLVHQKGQQHLIELASILQREGMDHRIVIAGNGPLEQQLRQMAVHAGVEKSITFLGFVWMAAKVYRTGILMYGKKSSWKEMWKWLRYSG